jgi:predicted O-methyltransferase YrrM
VLELIGREEHATISRPNAMSARVIRSMFAAGAVGPVVAEIGVGVGATTLLLAETLDHRGALHLFDWEDKLSELAADLAARGFTNVRVHPNSRRHWDSYVWTLGRMLQDGAQPMFDYIYLDGQHTFATDAAAFFLCDRLLRPGGLIEFDDYNWCFAGSVCMADIRHEFMTQEQIAARQVAMVVDVCVRDNAGYDVIVPNRLFRKVGARRA